MAQYSHYSQPDPDFLRFKQSRPPLPQPQNPQSDEEVIRETRERTISIWVPQNRAAFERYLPTGELTSFTHVFLHAYPCCIDVKYQVNDHTLPVEGGDISVRVVIPSDSKEETFPLIVYFHGGCTSRSPAAKFYLY